MFQAYGVFKTRATLETRTLINERTLYSNHYCTVVICCPSRVDLWTGRAAHNTKVSLGIVLTESHRLMLLKVTDVWAPFGGYPRIVEEGINDDYLPHWMQAAGYNTYSSGKIWNHHSVDNYNAPYAGGFNESDFLLDHHAYQYRNATMTRNGAPPVNYAGQYLPDLTAQKALDFLNEALSHKVPWFLVHAPIAPHSAVDLTPKLAVKVPGYTDRHAHLFNDYIIPRTEISIPRSKVESAGERPPSPQ